MPILSTDRPDWASASADHIRRSPARAGRCRVASLEGRSGAGKSSLADRIATELDCPLVHMDDLYPGWEGLADAVPLAGQWLIEPLLHGRDPRWRPYDWERGAYGQWQETAVGGTLLIEGCGSGARELWPYLSALIWVQTPEAIREQRLDDRADAAAYAPFRRMWNRQEDAFYRTHRPREHADLIIDNSTESTAAQDRRPAPRRP